MIPQRRSKNESDCIWTSSDISIASVDQNGNITTKKEGTVTITATSMYYPEISASCTVTVTENSTAIEEIGQEVSKTRYYDLIGTGTYNPKRGKVYIVDGKKVLFK